MTFKTVLLRAALLLALLIPAAPALAAQGSGCLPTTGTVSGLTLVQDINAAVAALISTNSGSSAPATDCTAAAIKGQLWLDTSTTPRTVRIYDGANWLAMGTVDDSGHFWAANASSLKLFGSSSGSTTLTPAATASGTLTLPASTDTLTGRATTDTLTNKTLLDGSTVIANTSDATKKLALDLSGITTGTTRTLAVPNASGTVALLSNVPLTGTLFGLTLANDGGTPASVIDTTTGSAADSTGAVLMNLGSAITKSIASSWAVGTGNGCLDTGSVANTTYHIYLIERPDTGVVDELCSTSATAPTMPTNYTLFRRIGSIVRSGGSILAFTQRGDVFRWITPLADLNASVGGTTAVTRTLTVPLGIVVRADIVGQLTIGTSGAALYLSELDTTDSAPGTAPYTTVFAGGQTNLSIAGGEIALFTNTSGQIRSRVSQAGVTVGIYTLGWTDTRGHLF